MTSLACLDEETAIALVQGSLASATANEIHDHVESCDSCRRVVAALARMPTVRRSSSATSREDIGEPTGRIADRYELSGVLGAGAMGIVYRAYDVQLARVVAIKRVRRDRKTDGHDRLVREARAMAQLAHPGVVNVFDAGIDDGAAYIVMELVEGETLRDWLATRRSWRAVGELFVQMARGLAAAHDAGIVHGDFKPDNVLVDGHGRARVADFGLARTMSAVDAPNAGLAGTPAYMAPELLDGAPSNAASDQYAWATSLHEALYGRRPHAATTISELRARHRDGAPRVRGAGVPGAVGRVIERGLAIDPGERFASMREAARALDAIPRRRARRAIAAVVGVTAVASGAIVWAAKSDPAAAVCTDGAAQLAEVWSTEHAASLTSSLADSPTTAAVVSTLDAYGERWRAQRKAACEATRAGEQSGDMLDRQIHCLDQRRESLRQVVAVVGDLRSAERQNAMTIVLGLPSLDACRDRGALLAQPAAPAEVQALEAELERAHAEANAGRFDAARTRYRAVVAGAERLRWSPLAAQAWMAIGHLELELGNSKLGDAALTEAIAAASRADDNRLVASTMIKMLAAVMTTTVQTAEAERMIKLADAAVTRAGDDPQLRFELHQAAGLMFNLRQQPAQSDAHYDKALAILKTLPDEREQLARLHVSRAANALDKGDVATGKAELEHARAAIGEPFEESVNAASYLNIACSAGLLAGELDQAHADCVRARDLFARRFGPDHPDTAAAEGNLGNVLLRQGKGIEALKLLERSHASTQATYGAEHPQTLLGRKNLADTLGQLGKHEAARDHWKAILAARERALGADHPKTVEIKVQLAGSEGALGQHARAIELLEQALPVLEKHYGARHHQVMTALNGIAMAYHATGKRTEAVAKLERVLAILDERNPDDPNVGIVTFNIAEIMREAGQTKEALAKYDAVLANLSKSLPPAHAIFGHVDTARAEALIGLGRGRDAIAAAERALPLRIAAGDEAATAQTELALAESLLLANGDRSRAKQLVTSAEARLGAAGATGEQWKARAKRLRARLR